MANQSYYVSSNQRTLARIDTILNNFSIKLTKKIKKQNFTFSHGSPHEHGDQPVHREPGPGGRDHRAPLHPLPVSSCSPPQVGPALLPLQALPLCPGKVELT